MKKTLLILLSFILLFGVGGVVALAEEPEEITVIAHNDWPVNDSGVDWTLYSDGTLTVSSVNGGIGFGNYIYNYKPYGHQPWYDYRDQIRRVVLDESVTTVSEYAFEYCTQLEEAVLPQTVTAIREYAFQNCTSLRTITLPGALTEIGKWAFNRCESLESISIPDTVRELQPYTFGCCYSLRSVSLPAYITALPEGVLHTCTSLQAISIPDGVTSVEERAFANCYALTAAELPATVTSVGKRAFSQCKSLDSFTAPGLQTIGLRAFEECAALKTVSAGGELTVGEEAFLDCENLETVDMPHLASVGKKAFYRIPGLRFASLSDRLSDVGYAAFFDCASLEAVAFSSDTPCSLSMNAFSGCASLKEISFPGGIEKLEGGAFSFCTSLEKVTLVEGIDSLSEGMFNSCKSLREIVIPAGVKAIGERAFYDCTALENVTFDSELQSIGNSAFKNTALRNVRLPDALTYLDKETFSNCEALESVSIGKNLSTLYNTTFAYTGSLVSISVDPENGSYSVGEDGCLYNKDKTVFLLYPAGRPMVDVTVPEGVEKLEKLSFCRARLSSLTLPDSLLIIDVNAIVECKGLTSLHIPGGTQEIYNTFCFNCADLSSITVAPENTEFYTLPGGALVSRSQKSLIVFPSNSPATIFEIPEGIEYISTSAFYNNPHLRTLILPVSMKTVGPYISGLSALEAVWYNGSEEDWRQVFVFSSSSIYYAEQKGLLHFNHPANHAPGEPLKENELPGNCTSAGVYDEVTRCALCGMELSRTHVETAATGHTWGEWEVIKQATTSEEGLMRRTCTNDPSHVEEEVIPKLQPQTSAFQRFIERIREFFQNIIDWFRKLFRF